MMNWLLSSVDPSRAHDIGLALSWHARLMVLSWGVLTPTAILVARFYKITPQQDWPQELDNPLWWNVHYLGQSVSFMMACVALLLVLISRQNVGIAVLHEVVGYLIMSFGLLQIVSGIFRGSKGGPSAQQTSGNLQGDHYDMTRRRLLFEFVHKTLGYITLSLIIVALLTGLWAANAPNWMWVAVVGWLCLLLIVGSYLQWRGCAYETYQAIWGPDHKHPGNIMPKQGFGVVRPSECPRFAQKKRE